jgi:signal transduction histidine kinase
MGTADQPGTVRAGRRSASGLAPPSPHGPERRAHVRDRREPGFVRRGVVVGGAVGPVGRRRSAVGSGMKRAFGIAVGVLSAAVVGVELVRPVHVVDLGARAGLETGIVLLGLIGVGLLAGRLNRTRQRRDLLLLAALATVVLTDFAFAELPLLGIGRAAGADDYGWLGCMLVAAVAFAAVAVVPDRRILSGKPRSLGIVAIAGLGTVVLAELFDLASGSRTHGALHQAGVATTLHDPLAGALVLISGGLLLVAGAAFLYRIGSVNADAAGRANPGAWLMAGACFLLAADVLQHLAAPAAAVDWVTPGDGLRVAAYGMLLAVALRRYVRTGQETARAALTEEREWIARDLHDGLAQDLAFIGIQAQALESQLGPEHPLMLAARSALAVSRGMIVDLAARSTPTTAAALRLVAAELELRFRVHVHVTVVADTGQGGPREPAPAEREHLVRIAREAITNAVQHGGATHVNVVLDCQASDQLLLVSDNGSGITQSALKANGGFGLPAMQARAASLGGRLRTQPGEDGGTRLEVLLGAAPSAALGAPPRRMRSRTPTTDSDHHGNARAARDISASV